jgi:rhamnosyltransferase
MPVTNPNVAVLLAAYNGMQWIEEQLTSIQYQTNVNVHIFISVDASTDGTGTWCEHYATLHQNVTLLPPYEGCGGAAKNFFRLIRDADLQPFDLVALADQDDRWYQEKLSRAAHYLKQHSVDIYSSNVLAFWANGRTRLLDKAQPQTEWDHYFEAAGPGCTYVMTNAFATYTQRQIKSHWTRIQTVSLHDWYIYALARTHGFTWYIDPRPGLDYRQHLNNQVGANVGLTAVLSRYRTIQSGWWFGQVKLIEGLVNQGRPNELRPAWRRFRRPDLLALCYYAPLCRRRRRDRLFFRAMCLIGAMFGAKIK